MISLMSDQRLFSILLYEHYILNVLIPKNSVFKINTHTIYTHFQFHPYSPVTFSTQIFWSLIVSAFVLCAGTIVVISMTINIWYHVKNLFDEKYFQFVIVKNKINRFIFE